MASIAFRTDASPQIGGGHIMRCMALAQHLHRRGFTPLFFTRSASLPLIHSREDWVGKVIEIPPEVVEADELEWLKTQSQQHRPAAWVLDGYQFNQEYRQGLKAFAGPLILLDDLNDSGPLHADLVINNSDTAFDLGYEKTAPTAELCLGSDYRLLRQEFTRPELSEYCQREGITLVMGASDPKNITLKLLQALEQHPLRHQIVNVTINVVTGAVYPFLQPLQQFLQHTKLHINHIHQAAQMAPLYSQARLVVSAAGSSQYEILACHSPAILVAVANNQLIATHLAEQQGWCQMVDFTQSEDIQALADKVLGLWLDDSALQSMNEAACKQPEIKADTLLNKIEQLINHHEY